MDEDELTADEIIQQLLDDFGLNTPQMRELLLDQLRDQNDPTIVLRKIRETDVYRRRFAGMARRAELGVAPIDEFEYMNLERGYRRVMQEAGLPSGFYDDPSDFAEFIGQDRSVAEIQSVVAVAEEAVNDADPATLNALREFYEVDSGDVVAYYLDPERATSVIEERRRLRAAGLAAAAETTVGQRLNVETAEALEREQVQRREIQQRLAGQEYLTYQTLQEGRMGTEAATSSELAAATFGLDRESVGRIAELRAGRAAAGAAQAGQAFTSEGIASLR
jgi:hypothetical protein